MSPQQQPEGTQWHEQMSQPSQGHATHGAGVLLPRSEVLAVPVRHIYHLSGLPKKTDEECTRTYNIGTRKPQAELKKQVGHGCDSHLHREYG